MSQDSPLRLKIAELFSVESLMTLVLIATYENGIYRGIAHEFSTHHNP
jgi:hypothetical protein